MTTIGQSSAAEIRAAALEAISHVRAISAQGYYAMALTDNFQRTTGMDTVTLKTTKDGSTINGESVAAYAARAAKVSSPGNTTAVVPKQSRQADVVNISPQAKAALNRAQIALAVMQKINGDTTDTKTANATAAATAEAAAASAKAGSSSLAPDGDASWSAKFASQFATEAADGADGRFYNSTDPDTLAPMMGDEEYASFKAAFDSKTLTIQPAQANSAVAITGEQDVSFTSNGAGKGMTWSGDMTIDTTKVDSKYALVTSDPFFGPTLITWGGPKDKSPAIASAK